MRVEPLFGVATPEKVWGTLGGGERAAGKLPLKPAHTIVLQGVKFLPPTPAGGSSVGYFNFFLLR